jgi:hypothetical protein
MLLYVFESNLQTTAKIPKLRCVTSIADAGTFTLDLSNESSYVRLMAKCQSSTNYADYVETESSNRYELNFLI